MAEARQCDRCNKFYSINDKNEKRGEYPITEDYKKAYKKPVDSMTLYDNNTNRIKHLDLCPECSRSLIVWLNDWGQYEAEKEKDCRHCKYDQYDYKLSECDPCAYCNEHDKFEPKED